MSETAPTLDVSDMPRASAKVRAIARRIGAHRKYDSLDRIEDALTLDEIADELDDRYELLRPLTQREREGRPEMVWSPANMVVFSVLLVIPCLVFGLLLLREVGAIQ